MSIYKKQNGKYYCKFQINGERHNFLCHGANSIKEAKEIENSFKYRIQQQQNGVIPRENKKVKVQTLLDLYDKHSRINKLSHGKDAFVKYIGLYFKKFIYANNIKTENIEDFKIWLKQERDSSPSTINKYIFALSKMYNLAISNKLLDYNPVNNVIRLRENNTKVRFLTKEEEQKLFKAIDENCPHIKNIVLTALLTGMRKGEILNLKWDNIDFNFNIIEILKSKSGKSRKIPLSNKLKEELIKIPRDSEYIFINKNTKEPYKDIKNSFHTALKKAHIENFRFHDLRHTVATRIIANGQPIPVAQARLGHARIETTMRYNHIIPTQTKQAIDILNSYC